MPRFYYSRNRGTDALDQRENVLLANWAHFSKTIAPPKKPEEQKPQDGGSITLAVIDLAKTVRSSLPSLCFLFSVVLVFYIIIEGDAGAREP